VICGGAQRARWPRPANSGWSTRWREHDQEGLQYLLQLSTEDRTEISISPKLVRDSVQQFAVTTGVALVNTLHTTCALFVNEFQSALIDDLKALIDRSCRSATATVTTIHECRIASAVNAHSHLRAALLGRNIAVA